jgi:translation initiation factor 1
VLLPSDQRVRIRQERRRGKVVTVIEGLDQAASDLKAIAKMLRVRCGAGGTVSGGAIEVQGDHRDVAAEVLRGLGYDVRDVRDV